MKLIITILEQSLKQGDFSKAEGILLVSKLTNSLGSDWAIWNHYLFLARCASAQYAEYLTTLEPKERDHDY